MYYQCELEGRRLSGNIEIDGAYFGSKYCLGRTTTQDYSPENEKGLGVPHRYVRELQFFAPVRQASQSES